MPNPTAALLVIGDEILSGRTREANVQVLATALAPIGVDLVEVRVVRDRTDAIISALDALREAYDIVVTSGGIGPTHDDITADSVAAAFGVPIGVRDDARALLEKMAADRGITLNEGQLRMARIPEGAVLITNSVSAAPGFRLGNVHVMAGVPVIFEAMVAATVGDLPTGVPVIAQSVVVGRGEGHFAATLAAIAAEFDDLSIGSYPFRRDGTFAVELVVRGTDAARVAAAIAVLQTEIVDQDTPARTSAGA